MKQLTDDIQEALESCPHTYLATLDGILLVHVPAADSICDSRTGRYQFAKYGLCIFGDRYCECESDTENKRHRIELYTTICPSKYD